MAHVDTLKTFLAVIQMKSFSRAAEQLHMTQPAISFQVKKLERLYKAKLLERKSRSIELTEAGKVLQSYANRLLDLIKESEHAVLGVSEKGQQWVRAGATSSAGTFLLANLLGIYKRSHPEVEVIMKTGKFYDLLTMLAEDQIDLCLSMVPRPVEPYGFKSEPFRQIAMKAIASPSNPLSKKKKIALSRFAEEPFILQAKGRLNRDVIESFFSKKNLSLRTVMEFDTLEAIKAAVKENFGVSIIQEYILSSELSAKRLKVLPVEGLGISLTLSIVYRRQKRVSAAAQDFLDFVRQASAKGD